MFVHININKYKYHKIMFSLKWLLYTYVIMSTITVLGNELKFSNFSLADYFTNDDIVAISQDKQDFMWFVTSEGVLRYDGQKHKKFVSDPNNPNTLSSDLSTCIVADQHGYIWIGTQHGLNRFDPKTETFKRYFYDENNKNSIYNNKINLLYIDNKERLWIVTGGCNIHLYNYAKDNFYRYRIIKKRNNCINSLITSMFIDRTDTIWLGTVRGLFINKIMTSTFTKIKSIPNKADSLHGEYITAITEDSKHQIWLATQKQGINIYNPQTKQYSHLTSNPEKQINLNQITNILENKKNKYWFTTKNKGIIIYDSETKTYQQIRYNPEKSTGINSDKINYIYKNRCGTIWIASYLCGLNKFNYSQQKFVYYSPATYNGNTKDYLNIKYFIKAGTHKILIVNKYNIYQYNKLTDKFTNLSKTILNSPKNAIISCYYQDGEKVYLGTTDKGIYVYNPQKEIFTRIKIDQKASSQQCIVNMNVDQSMPNQIWFTTLFGIYSMNKKNEKIFIHLRHNQLNYANIKYIKIIANKIMWINTTQGYFKYNLSTNEVKPYIINGKQVMQLFYSKIGEKWISINNGIKHIDKDNKTTYYPRFDPNELRSFIIIKEDSEHNIWMSYGHTFKKYNPQTKKMTTYSKKDGLKHPQIIRILEDSKKNLWLIHSYSISKLNIKTGQFTIFDKKNGIELLNFYRANIIDDTIYIAGDNGIMKFNTQLSTKNNYSYKTVITDIQLFNTSLEMGKQYNGRVVLKNPPQYCKEITLKYHEAVAITLKFTTLNYQITNNNFRYTLVGFEKSWNHINGYNSVTYKKLKPGSYTFMVQGQNHDQTWAKVAQLKINIILPFWQTLWFKAVFIIIMIALVYKIHTILSKKIIYNNQKLNQQMNEITDIEKDLEQHRDHLEELVLKRTNELNKLHKKLLDTARLAGKAETVTSVLHNAGNSLNSIKIDVAMLETQLTKSKSKVVEKIADMINIPTENLYDFFTKSEKGKKIPLLLQKVADNINNNREIIKQQVQDLKQHIEQIATIIKIQLTHSKSVGYTEKITIDELIADALKITENSIIEHGISLNLQNSGLPPSALDRHSIIQIITTLIQNAKDSLIASRETEKLISINTYMNTDKMITVTIFDNGVGIEPKKIDNIFSLGYTNKANGSGFGLHAAKDVAKEMGGKLTIKSLGINKGATLTLTIPFIDC